MAIALSGSLNLSGSFTATGTITAQTLVVQTVTSSIDYVTGSTQWGSVIGNTHTITGSLGVSGSMNVNANTLVVNTNGTVSIGNTNSTYNLDVTGTFRATGAATFSSSVTAGGFPSFIASQGGNPTYDLISTQTIYSAARNWRISTNYNAWGNLEFLVSTAMGGTPDQSKMVINSSGNVGIGTTSPGYLLDVNGSANFSTRVLTPLIVQGVANASITMQNTADAGSWFLTAGSTSGYVTSILGTGNYATSNPGTIIFTNASVERMRITNVGNVIHKAYNVGEGILWNFNGGATYGFYNNNSGGFTLTNSGVANVGVFNMSTGAYTPTSDINRKKDFEESTIGLKEILELKPTLYRMKTDDTKGDKELGFIAQEVKEFIPQAYVQSDDFIGLNFNPIVAALVKGMQEQQAQIEELKAEIDELKNK